MRYHNLHIRRFIVLFIVIFVLGGSILLTLLAYVFGFRFIQDRYTTDYVEAAFQSSVSEIDALIQKCSLLTIDIYSDRNLQTAFVSTLLSEDNRVGGGR